MTNRIPEWSRNLSLNAPRAELDEVGRSAFRHSARSVGLFVRRLYGEALLKVDRAAALKVFRIRRQYHPNRPELIPAEVAAMVAPHDHTVRESRNDFVESI